MDLIHKITKYVDHNRYVVLAVIITAAIMIFGLGCTAMTAAVSDPAVKVDRIGLDADIANVNQQLTGQRTRIDADIANYNAAVVATNSKIDAAVADLDRQDAIKAELFNLAGSTITAITTGGVTTEAAIGTALTAGSLLFGIGAAADSRRKDKVIAKQKQIAVTATATA